MGRNAIFCAMFTVIEQCKAEVAVDVFHTAKSIRIQKPGAIVSVVSVLILVPITNMHS